MAIIYTYPLLTTLQGSDLLLISDTSNNNSTKSVTLADIGAFLGTPAGTGTTNALTRWTDGAAGLLGDSIVAQNVGATILTVTGNFITTGTVPQVRVILLDKLRFLLHQWPQQMQHRKVM